MIRLWTGGRIRVLAPLMLMAGLGSVTACNARDAAERNKSSLAVLAESVQGQEAAQRVAVLDEQVAQLDERLGRMEKKLEEQESRSLTAWPTKPWRSRLTARGGESEHPGGDESRSLTAWPTKPWRSRLTALGAGSDHPGGDESRSLTARGAESEFRLTWEPEGPVSVVLWHSYRGREKEALVQSLQAFQKAHPDWQVDAQEVPFSAFRDKIVVTVPKGNGPDLFIFAHNVIGDWVLKGEIVTPLASYIEKSDGFDSLSRFLPDTVKALAYQGQVYGLPLAFKSHALFYNRKLVSTPPTTLAELVQKATAVQTGEDEDRIYGLLYNAGLLYNHALWAQGLGTVLMDDQGVPSLTGEAMVRSVELVRDLHQRHGLIPPLDDNMATFLFNSGQVAFVVKGPWFLGEVDPAVDFGVALLPVIAPGQPARPFLGSEGVFLSHTARSKEAAFQVLRYLVSHECALVRYQVGRQLVANLSVYEELDRNGQSDPVLEVFRKQAESSVVMSSRPEMQAVWSPVDNALRTVVYGKADAAAALKEAQQKVDRDIAGMGK